MPIYCAAVNCISKSDLTISSFFRFPKDTYRLVALIKYLYRMLYWCQVFSPVFCQCEASVTCRSACFASSAPSISLPFFPLPIGLVQNAGRGGIAGRDRRHVQNAGVRDPLFSRTFCTIPKIRGTGSGPAGLHGISGARDDATSGKPQCS